MDVADRQTLAQSVHILAAELDGLSVLEDIQVRTLAVADVLASVAADGPAAAVVDGLAASCTEAGRLLAAAYRTLADVAARADDIALGLSEGLWQRT